MILVTGATGNIGKEVVKLLVESGTTVRALTRDPKRAAFPQSVEVVKGDLTKPETLPLKGVEKVFLLAGAMELPAISRDFVKAAKIHGAKHIVLNSSGTVGLKKMTKIGSWHLEAEEFLKGSGIAWTMLRPGNFASNTLRWAGMIRGQGTVFAPQGSGPTAPIDPRDIGSVAVTALTGKGHEGKTYVLTGPEAMTIEKQVQIIGKAIGKQLKFIAVPESKAREGMLKSGLPEVLADAIVELVQADGPETVGHITQTIREVTGKAPRTFAEWVRDHAGAFA